MSDCYEYPTTRTAAPGNYKHRIEHIYCLQERLNAVNGGGGRMCC